MLMSEGGSSSSGVISHKDEVHLFKNRSAARRAADRQVRVSAAREHHYEVIRFRHRVAADRRSRTHRSYPVPSHCATRLCATSFMDHPKPRPPRPNLSGRDFVFCERINVPTDQKKKPNYHIDPIGARHFCVDLPEVLVGCDHTRTETSGTLTRSNIREHGDCKVG